MEVGGGGRGGGGGGPSNSIQKEGHMFWKLREVDSAPPVGG